MGVFNLFRRSQKPDVALNSILDSETPGPMMMRIVAQIEFRQCVGVRNESTMFPFSKKKAKPQFKGY